MSDTMSDIMTALQSTGLPCAYGKFLSPQSVPFLVYVGSGQNVFRADNENYYTTNTYRVEYYFTHKDEDAETAIESALDGAGYYYDKSDDIFDQSEGVYHINYYLQ